MEKLGLHTITIDRKSAQPYELQWWDQYDIFMELTESGMMKELPAFVTDPTNKAKVEALIAGRAQVGEEATKKLGISA
jgi:hypothetical protein